MNAIGLLKGAASSGGPVVFGAGTAMLAMTLVSVVRGTGHAAAWPRPTVTATATVVQRVPYPVPSRTPGVARTVVDAGAPEPGGGSPAPARTGGAGAQEHAATGHSSRRATGGQGGHARPAPSPSPAPSCSDGVLLVRLPLGVMPRCAITIGGNR